jgi:heterodisulfide reductase subunit C
MAVKRTDIEKLIHECRLTSCLECGKCTASCPLSELFGDVTFGRTPRGIIEMALLDADLVTGDAIWHCLTCDVCTKGCPSGVRFRDFIYGLRRLALAAGINAFAVHCKRCDSYFLPEIHHKLLIEQLSSEDIPSEFLLLCPRCRAIDFSEKVKKNLPGKLKVE